MSNVTSKFSILLSLYNKECATFLNDCLASIEDNTLQPDQVVIVFDGPVRKELELVVENYSLRLPITVTPISTNVGLGSALNHGLKHCKYNVVIRMDTDDICLPMRFERQMSFMEEHPHVVLLGSAVEEYDEDMKLSRGIRFSAENDSEIREYIKRRNPFNHMSVAFRKSAIEAVGGYQHHACMEDYNLWIRVVSKGYQVCNLSDILVNVRAGKSMIARRNGLSYIKSEIQLAQLKYNLKIDKGIGVISTAVLRIIPRLLPVNMLESIYKLLRK